MTAAGDRATLFGVPRRRLLGMVLAAVVALVAFFFTDQGSGEPPGRGSQVQTQVQDEPSGNARGSDGEGADPLSGLAWVDVSALPDEARNTLELIDSGGPFPYDRDGITFGNREGILPQRDRGHYREYTVETPGIDHRGARRIVTGGSTEFYWTEDHYESFERIRR